MLHLFARSFDGEKPWWMMAEEDWRVVAAVERRPAAKEEGDGGVNNRDGGDRDPLTVGGGLTHIDLSQPSYHGLGFVHGRVH